MYAVGILLYVLVCGTVAWLLAKLLTRRAKVPWIRLATAAALTPIMFFVPLADEIVGRYQFERLCEQAKEVKIHGTIPVGEELYTSSGAWRIGQAGPDAFRLRKIIDGYLRHESKRLPDINRGIEIWASEHKIYGARDGELLAEWNQYSTSGGWLSRNFQTPILVRPQCLPERFWEIEQRLLRFSTRRESAK